MHGSCIHPERHKNGDRNPSFGFNTQSGYGHCYVCGTLLAKEVCQVLNIDPDQVGGLVERPQSPTAKRKPVPDKPKDLRPSVPTDYKLPDWLQQYMDWSGMTGNQTPMIFHQAAWAGALTFQQLYDDLAHYVTNVMKGKGIHRTNYLPDCIQHGFMALWLELSENKDFLTDKTRQQAVFFYSGAVQNLDSALLRRQIDSFEALMSYDWRGSWDEHTNTGYSAPSGWWNSVEQWATWVSDIDIRIGVEQIMQKLAEKYADSFKHLVALYAVITHVTRKDAALAGVTPWNCHKTYEEPMLQVVQYWREQHQQGHTEPAEARRGDAHRLYRRSDTGAD